MFSLSSAKPKPKSSVKAAIGAVRDFIGGSQEDEETVSENLVAQNSVEAMPQPQAADEEVKTETIDQPDKKTTPPELRSDAVRAGTDQKWLAPETGQSAGEFTPSKDFDQAVRNLRAGESAEKRAAAARILGEAGSQRATPHLIAALFDADATRAQHA